MEAVSSQRKFGAADGILNVVVVSATSKERSFTIHKMGVIPTDQQMAAAANIAFINPQILNRARVRSGSLLSSIANGAQDEPGGQPRRRLAGVLGRRH
jgi:hypothetical protein